MKLAISLITFLCVAQMALGVFQVAKDGWLDLNNIHYELNSVVSWFTRNMGTLKPANTKDTPAIFNMNTLKFKFSSDLTTVQFNRTVVLSYHLISSTGGKGQLVVCIIL